MVSGSLFVAAVLLFSESSSAVFLIASLQFLDGSAGSW